MSQFCTSAILIRRRDYGDYDLIVTFFTLSRGKVSLIAKSAKKSVRRFAGVLELFSELDIAGAVGRRSGLPVLQEAALKEPFARIRAIPTRIAYASYWAELIHAWMEDHVAQAELYHLLRHGLRELDRGVTPEAVLSILFQMRLLRLSGHSPNLELCGVCRKAVDAMPADVLGVDIAQGGIACLACMRHSEDGPYLSKGTIKQMQWIAKGDLARAARIRFTPAAMVEALGFLERFVPYHLGRQPRSLHVLRQLRGNLS
jgi:DNA repair protein RecO (recombination protein O)